MRYQGEVVEIMSMSQCPNRCPHCFVTYEGEIPFKTLDHLMADLVPLHKEVILNGTELLMDDAYLDMCGKYKQDFIYTNGKLLTKEKMEVLKRNDIHRISVSLHYGQQESISRISLNEVVDVIEQARDEGFEVRVLCVISKENLMLVPEICDFVASLHIRGVKFINLLYSGGGQNFKDKLLDEKDLPVFFDLLHQAREKYDKEKFYITRAGNFGYNKKYGDNFICPAGKDFVLLTPNGSVYPCNAMVYPEYRIGHWDETGIYIEKQLMHGEKTCMALNRQLNILKGGAANEVTE